VLKDIVVEWMILGRCYEPKVGIRLRSAPVIKGFKAKKVSIFINDWLK
jgi:hypothetical protein